MIQNLSVACNRWLFLSLFLLLATVVTGQDQNWMRGKELTWNPMAQAQNPDLKYHALVIGVGTYIAPEHGEGWPSLASADNDALAVADILRNEYGFNVKTLVNEEATREAILRGLDTFVDFDVDDAAIIYFAGHGYFDENLGEGFWIPHDGIHLRDGRPARDGWIWNSTVSTILSGIKARHVLVIADSCFGGTLFRGDTLPPASQDLQWYKRVNAKPSRYLISSGDYEPVPDGGENHSVFTQNLLDYLSNPGQGIFSASDIGTAIRRAVSEKTGQMVRMGSLGLASDAGGELVFIQAEVVEPPRNKNE
jgi:Caspase domain